jgi:hypothetical protein
MPNYVTNIITIQDCDIKLKKQILIENINEKGNIDFNCAVPMPKELMIEESTYTNIGMDILKKELDPNFIISHNLQKMFDAFNKEKQNETLALGQQALDNIEKYGVKSWYDFAINYWGTKWNSSNTFIENININNATNHNDISKLIKEANVKDITFSLQTAWSNPEEWLIALSKKYPDATFYIEYADEDKGHNCGFYYLNDGDIFDSENDIENPEENWMKFAFHLSYGEDVIPEAYGYDSNWEWSEETEENYYKKQEMIKKLQDFG